MPILNSEFMDSEAAKLDLAGELATISLFCEYGSSNFVDKFLSLLFKPKLVDIIDTDENAADIEKLSDFKETGKNFMFEEI